MTRAFKGWLTGLHVPCDEDFMQVVTCMHGSRFLPTTTSGVQQASKLNGKEGAFHRKDWTTRFILEYVQQYVDISKTYTRRGVVAQAETQPHPHLLWQILVSEYDPVTSQQKMVHFALW